MFLTTSASDESYDFRWWISITAFSVLMGSKYLFVRPDDGLEVMLLSGPFPEEWGAGEKKGKFCFCDLSFLLIGQFVVLVISYPKYLKAIQRVHK